MRMLLAAIGLAAAFLPSARATPGPQTLYTRPDGPIDAFAQDGPVLAWFAPSAKSCNSVYVYQLTNGLQLKLPDQRPGARNVTCGWDVEQPVRLALAGTDALWTLPERAPLKFDYLLGAGARDTRERRFQEIAHAGRGAGLWLGGIAGDGTTLVYAVTSVDYVDEVGCLAGTGSCAMKIAGGGVYRLLGRNPPELVPGTSAAVAVSTSAGAVAYVPAAGVGKDGTPLAGADLPIEIRVVDTGALVSQIMPTGIPIALALSPDVLTTLEQTPLGLRLAWYDRWSGAPSGSIPVPATTSPELTANDQLVVFHVGRLIRAVNLISHRVRTLVTAAAAPIGLSLEGSRLAWAENVAGRGRIRALSVGRP